MQMGPKEIAVEYRTAANKNKQITVLADLNQCAKRDIVQILVDQGEQVSDFWLEKLSKQRRQNKTKLGGMAPVAVSDVGEQLAAPAAPHDGEPVSPAEPATDRDLFEAVATLLPEAEQTPKRQRPGENGVPVAPRNEYEARHWVDGVGPVPLEPDCRADAAPTVREVRRVEVPRSIPIEELLREACRLMASALALSPDEYHTYSCGVLDLVHALTEE